MTHGSDIDRPCFRVCNDCTTVGGKPYLPNPTASHPGRPQVCGLLILSHVFRSSMGSECQSPFILSFIIMYMSGELHTRVTVRSVSRDLLEKATVVISSRSFTFFMEPQCLQEPPAGLYLSQLTAVYIFTSYLINTHFNIILPYNVCLRSFTFLSGYPSEKSAYNFHFSDACFTPRLSSPCYAYLNNVVTDSTSQCPNA